MNGPEEEKLQCGGNFHMFTAFVQETINFVGKVFKLTETEQSMAEERC